EIIIGVSAALGTLAPTATATSGIQDTATGTPTSTPQATSTTTVTFTLIPTATATVAALSTSTATATQTPTDTPTTGPTVVVSGSCSHPGSGGLEPCPPNTGITVSRCLDPTGCLHDGAARSRVGSGLVLADGTFTVTLPQQAVENRQTLIFEADLAGVAYR